MWNIAGRKVKIRILLVLLGLIAEKEHTYCLSRPGGLNRDVRLDLRELVGCR